MTELVLKVRSLKMLSRWRLIGENVGWKMVYNFLGIDEKHREIYLFSIRMSVQCIRTSVQCIQAKTT